MDKQTFPEWLHAMLDEKGWTQADLCRASRGEIKSGTLADIMTGRRELGKKMGQAIAAALDVPPWQVFEAAGYWERPKKDNLDDIRDRIKFRLDRTKNEKKLKEWDGVLGVLEEDKPSGRIKRESAA